MEYWKNITIVLPGHDLKVIADQLIELNILSVSIQDLRDNKESDWFHFYNKPIKYAVKPIAFQYYMMGRYHQKISFRISKIILKSIKFM